MADALEHLSSGRTRIEWLSSLNTEFQPKKHYRRTSIICTIGTQISFRDVMHGLLQRTDRPTGPKTNSAAKINILRKGTIFTHKINVRKLMGAYSWLECRPYELFPRRV